LILKNTKTIRTQQQHQRERELRRGVKKELPQVNTKGESQSQSHFTIHLFLSLVKVRRRRRSLVLIAVRVEVPMCRSRIERVSLRRRRWWRLCCHDWTAKERSVVIDILRIPFRDDSTVSCLVVVDVVVVVSDSGLSTTWSFWLRFHGFCCSLFVRFGFLELENPFVKWLNWVLLFQAMLFDTLYNGFEAYKLPLIELILNSRRCIARSALGGRSPCLYQVRFQ
jgi:hypothetical protein